MTLITELTDERLEKNYFVRDVILMRDSLRVALTEKAAKDARINDTDSIATLIGRAALGEAFTTGDEELFEEHALAVKKFLRGEW